MCVSQKGSPGSWDSGLGLQPLYGHSVSPQMLNEHLLQATCWVGKNYPVRRVSQLLHKKRVYAPQEPPEVPTVCWVPPPWALRTELQGRKPAGVGTQSGAEGRGGDSPGRVPWPCQLCSRRSAHLPASSGETVGGARTGLRGTGPGSARAAPTLDFLLQPDPVCL